MRKTNFLMSIVIVSCCIIGTQACRQRTPQSRTQEVAQTPAQHHDQMEMKEGAASINKAICVLQPTEGSKTSGTITFTQTDSGIRVVADIQGLTPGKHGFHVHEFGDCSSPDGKAAGDHFNPTGQAHGPRHGMSRHVGDLGNIEAGKDGIARVEMVDSLITFEGNNSIIGRAVIVHASEDDLKSQPSGNSGARIAQGVIGIAR